MIWEQFMSTVWKAHANVFQRKQTQTIVKYVGTVYPENNKYYCTNRRLSVESSCSFLIKSLTLPIINQFLNISVSESVVELQ